MGERHHLKGGDTTHHKPTINMAMRKPDGSIATNAKENLSVFGPHFSKVLDNERTTDKTVLDLIPQRPKVRHLDKPITIKEVNIAINKLKKGKSPGLDGVPPEALKAMNPAMRREILRYISEFFEGEADYEGWHKSRCVPVPKKGDQKDPNKWRGIMLMEICSKVLSSIMTARAFKLLKKYGTRFQFGGTPGVGCRDGLFTLKSLLNARHNHGLLSYVGFVDLVKAYDTADHEMLLSVLERYGAPPKFVSAVEKMYENNIVVLKIEKESVEMRQTVGVRQGDNMAPVLFLFMMNAFAESLEIVWKQKEITVLKVMTTNADAIEDGQVCSHTQAMYKSKSLTTVEIFQCLYVDDGAFPFETREDMIQGMNLIYHHFARFGLEMHIGRDGKESKTECVFFPPPQFIATKVSQTTITAEAPTTIDMTNTVTPTTNMIDTPPTTH